MKPDGRETQTAIAEVPNRCANRAIPWLWLGASLFWPVVIIVTDQVAWPLALWIATTIGPIAHLGRSKRQVGPADQDS